MDIKTFLGEIWSLIKKEKWIILGSSAVIAFIAVGILFVLQSDFSSDDNGIEDEISVPVEFETYIEQELEGAFANSYLLEILMTQPDVVNEIEAETQVDITSELEEFAEENEPIYTPDDPINVERNPSSNVMEMTIDVGTDEENFAVAEAYETWLTTNESEFFDNKDVYIITAPDFMEEDELANISNNVTTLTLLLQFVVGLIIGLIVGFGVAVLKVLLSDKIQYGFTYGWASKDIYIKEQEQVSDQKIAHDILSSDLNSLVVLSEQKLSESLEVELDKVDSKQFSVEKEISQLSLDKTVDEFIIIVTRHHTTKDWYQAQRKDLQLYPNARVKIVEKA